MKAPVSRRQLLCLSLGLSLTRLTEAAPVVLPSSVSLQDDLALALKADKPLVVMVSLPGCPFCKIARENYLGPMRAQQGLAVMQIDMRNQKPVKDFQGASTTQDALTRKWGIKVAPTVLFFGPGGAEMAERLVGGYLPDFYGTYLEERLLAAQANILKQRH